MADATIIDGKASAADLRRTVGAKTAALTAATAVIPGLAVVLVGDDPASQVYVRNKSRAAHETGMRSFDHRLPADTPQEDLLALIDRLNHDPLVHGILVQLPLPKQIDSATVLAAIDPAKDVDGFHLVNVGRLGTGAPLVVPCTPLGSLMLLRRIHGSLAGAEALVIGRSNIVGRPMAQLLTNADCTVTVAHSRTRNLADHCRRAEILVSAMGRPHMIRGAWIRPGATVIDVGIIRVPGTEPGTSRLVGDVCYAEALPIAGAITPVPGGVGPMTIACLLLNTLAAACRSTGQPVPEEARP